MKQIISILFGMDINQDKFSEYAERLGYKTYFTDKWR